MRMVDKKRTYFYSSIEAVESPNIDDDLETIVRMGYGNIIIMFYDIEDLKLWIRTNPIKDLSINNMTHKPNIIFRFHLTSREESLDSREIRKFLNKLVKLEERHGIKLIKSIDEAVTNIINPNIMEYYRVRLIRLNGFRWGVLKRFHKHKVYFEVILDRLFKDRDYTTKALPRLEPLEEMGKLLFTQLKPGIKPEEVPFILSALTDKRYASYGPIVRWGDLVW